MDKINQKIKNPTGINSEKLIALNNDMYFEIYEDQAVKLAKFSLYSMGQNKRVRL